MRPCSWLVRSGRERTDERRTRHAGQLISLRVADVAWETAVQVDGFSARQDARLLADSATFSGNKTFLSSCHWSIHKLRVDDAVLYWAVKPRRGIDAETIQQRPRLCSTWTKVDSAVLLLIIYEPMMVDLYDQDRSALRLSDDVRSIINPVRSTQILRLVALPVTWWLSVLSSQALIALL